MEKLDSSLLDLLLLYMGQYNRGCNTIRVLHVPERLFSVLLRERNFKNKFYHFPRLIQLANKYVSKSFMYQSYKQYSNSLL